MTLNGTWSFAPMAPFSTIGMATQVVPTILVKNRHQHKQSFKEADKQLTCKEWPRASSTQRSEWRMPSPMYRD